MKRLQHLLLFSDAGSTRNNIALLVFRILISAELIFVHGLKKIGIGVDVAEVVPNPLHLPEILNSSVAIFANLVAPAFVVFGLGTRIASLLVLCVTMTGLLAMHLHDDPMVRDIPFMYSCCFLLLLVTGAGKMSIDHVLSKPCESL